MPSLLNAIKAHHSSLNAAYTTYYAPGSTTTSRSNSTTTPSSQTPKPPTNAAKTWAAIKQHHRDMNAAYTAYYSPGASPSSSRTSSVITSPRGSAECAREGSGESQGPRNWEKVWGKVRRRAGEHHRGVSTAVGMT